jgi:RNA polymerase sigma factor (sigma-70 family)
MNCDFKSLELNEELSLLTGKQREVFILRFGFRMTLAEIADRIGISVHSVWDRLERAREKLPLSPRVLTNGRHRNRTTKGTEVRD